ncbi:uncharacterized protein LOC131144462 isoform X2 [Malania oleifera]|uniref:uncharacterized protein LOC131144462 isoform X2 n=1 Tax=Malania oleifera TaxID=397392 RepID=UPI0025ADB890|nr:uncharacterized protein LOC131144462 isoform X2 [Malania oleifera]
MENSITTFTKTLASFCNHLQNTSNALKQSLDRRPIPLDSASSTFIQCLNRRLSSLSADLNLLDSMSFGTVSFEELLGHCNEVYKKNQSDIAQLEDRLMSFGYIPELDIDESEEVSGLSTPRGSDLKVVGLEDQLDPPSTLAGSIIKEFEEDHLFEESLNLRTLGLSDACLATLASDATDNTDSPDISFQATMKRSVDKQHEIRRPHQSAVKSLGMNEGEEGNDRKLVGAPRCIINVSKDDYDSLPSYMKSLASWEDLLTAVEKMNSNLGKKGKTRGNSFQQDELASLDLGAKGRSYLLLLLRMNRLAVETVEGLIAYRVL